MTEHTPPHPAFIVRRGNKNVDIATWITSSTLSAGIDQVAEIETVVADPALQRIGAAGLFVVGESIVDYDVFKMSLAAIEVSGGEAGTGQARLQWRPRLVRGLKRRRGPHVLRGVSASQYVTAEAKAAGAILVFAQETARRTQIARDVPKDAEPPEEGANYPSAWTTFQRLAREEGFIVFEYAGVIYFGRPSWVRARRKERNVVRWIGGTEQNQSIGFPTVRKSEDSPTLVTIECFVPRNRVNDFRPGWSFDLEGLPYYSGAYMTSQVSMNLTLDGLISVTAMSAIDPRPGEVQGSETTERGIGTHKELVDAAIKAGFKEANLLTAVAVALAESGGDRKAISPPNRGGSAPGSRDWGLWQINDHFHVFDKILILDALYNAKMAFTISKSGTDWTPWTTFRNGAYRRFLDDARASIETSQSVAPAVADPAATAAGTPNPAAEAELSRNAVILRRAVVARFGEMTIHGWGRRPNKTEHDDLDPRTGRRAANALDFMVGRDMSKGQAIADFVEARWQELNVDYLIWNRRITSFDSRGWRRYTGANPHVDHPHVTVNPPSGSASRG